MVDTQIVEQYPLSPLQHGMLFHALRAPGSGTDIEQMLCTLGEAVDAGCLRRAWGRVVERHAILRTAFRCEAGSDPCQFVQPRVDVPWRDEDWRDLTEAEQTARLDSLLAEDRRRGFEMHQAPLLRLACIRMAEAEYRPLWTFHHALLDGRSFPTVLDEAFAFYEAFQAGADLHLPAPRPYREYIDWLHERDFSQAASYWRRELDAFRAPTPLVVERPSGAGEAAQQGDESLVLSASIFAKLAAFAERNEVTLGTLVQGAWALLLSRYSGEEDVLYGVVRACRKSSIAGADQMLGLFINTLPLRVRTPEEARLGDWLHALRLQWLSMRDYEHTPLVAVQKCSQIPPGRPLFQSILMFETYDLDSRMRQKGGAWANRSIRLYEQTGYPLTVTVYSGTELRLQIEYEQRRFDKPVIQRMLLHLATLLEGMLAGVTQRLRDLPMLTRGEYATILQGWNDTRRAYPREMVLHRLFEAQVERTPDAVAAVQEDGRLTYAELNRKSNQLAHYLRRKGVGPDVLVGVCAERSLEMVVALYAVLKAGGAYVPIDPDYPAERLDFMLWDAAAPVLLTQSRLLGRLPAHAGEILCLDTDWESIAAESTANPAATAGPTNLAYMIYTSGSTGRPKGALNSHRAITNRLLWMQSRYQLTAADVVLQKTPFSFDVSVWEFFWPLLAGARLVLARPGGHRDPAYLVRLIREQAVTVLHFVPSMLSAFLEEPGAEMCLSLRNVICSGEALPYELQERLFERLPASLHNLYGPTEAAVDVTHWTCVRRDARKIVPIGRPVANTQVYILDRLGRPVPVGVPGELHIGGVQVGLGYHKRPELTAGKFIPDRFGENPAGRLYKTGDVCRWLPDGAIEYLGRADFQVKIRGLRVEMGEIESALRAHPAVKEAAVVAQGTAADQRLVAYFVPSDEQPASDAELRRHLQRSLPEYMIPAAFVRLREMPLSANGKLDRKGLPEHGISPDPAEASWPPPENSAEQAIAHVWEKALGVERVGRDSNFFDLGGHSLLLIRVRRDLEELFSKELPIVEMFRYPTVRSLAQYLADAGGQSAIVTRSREQLRTFKEAARRRQQRRSLSVN